MLHFLGCKFCSPFINLYLYPDEFVNLVENWDKAVAAGLENVKEVKDAGMPFPVGILESTGSRIFFNHDTDFEVALAKWRERVARIRPDKTIFMFTAAKGNETQLRRFDAINVDSKIAFASPKLRHLNLPSLQIVKGWDDDDPEYNMSKLVNSYGKLYIQSYSLIKRLSSLAKI